MNLSKNSTLHPHEVEQQARHPRHSVLQQMQQHANAKILTATQIDLISKLLVEHVPTILQRKNMLPVYELIGSLR